MESPCAHFECYDFTSFLICFVFLGTWKSQHQCGINKVKKKITADMKYTRITLHTEYKAYSKMRTSL